jgi:hypothetical protein
LEREVREEEDELKEGGRVRGKRESRGKQRKAGKRRGHSCPRRFFKGLRLTKEKVPSILGTRNKSMKTSEKTTTADTNTFNLYQH